MTTTEERISALETRVNRLETWAGPGQVEVLMDGVRGIRADTTVMRRVLRRHSRELARMKTDMADVTSGMAEITTGIGEILRRLREKPASD